MFWSCCRFLIVLLVVSPLAKVTSSPVMRQKRSDDAGPLQSVVEQLSQQITSLNAQLTSVNTQLTSVNDEVSALKAKTASLDKVVAFHAWNNHNPVHAAAHSPVVLSHAATNIGNGYDTLTGVFTAPVSGLYDFQASFMNHDTSSDHYVRAAIFVDNKIEAATISDSQQGSFDHGTMKAIVHVNAGQKVYMKNTDGTDELYWAGESLPYTTFSGFLIKAD